MFWLLGPYCELQLRGTFAKADAAPRVRDAMMNTLPSSWLDGAVTHLDLLHTWKEARKAQGGVEPSGGKDELEKGSEEFNNVYIVGSKMNSIHAGLECAGLGNLRLCAAWPRSYANREPL